MPVSGVLHSLRPVSYTHLDVYKRQILENDSYVDALLDMAGTIYTVNLTRDTLERNISPAGKSD